MSVQQREDNDNKKGLKPLSKEEALASIKKFKNDFGLNGVRTSRERIQNILRNSGLLSEEVDVARREQDI